MFEAALISLVLGAGVLSQPRPAYRSESQPVAGGAELVTVFARLNGPASAPIASGAENSEVPILAVLRDSLGDDDPANDRLRSVWILTSTRPTPWQRAASALTFGFFRAGSKRHAGSVPSPTLDLASPGKSVYSNLFGDGLQVIELDPLGAPIRATTRTYRTNSSDYTKLQIFQALTSLDNLALASGSPSALPDSQLREIYARLSLSTHTFGGLVREQYLSRYYDKENSRQEQTRGHNWELLRQRAELNGLYFEPLAIGDASPSQALLWIARTDLEARAGHSFNGQFLGIANPWTDDRLLHWNGYSQTRYLDSDNSLVTKETPGAQSVEMIPLALYSLDYPRVPLLLADFRHSLTPKRREMLSQGATGLVTGVFGLTRFGNPEFFVADWAWTFVRGRHGATVNRTARLRAYSGARQFLAMDSSLDPRLKIALQIQLDHLALNPRENETSHEATLAREQYGTLLQFLNSPRGVAKLEKDRQKELDSYTKPAPARMAASLGHVFTGAPHVDPNNDLSLRTELDARRRSATQMRFLQQVLAAGPRPDVVWDSDAIRKSVEDLSADPNASPEAHLLIAQVYARTGDADLRSTCWRALQVLNERTPAAREVSAVAPGQ
ncbi:MAG TPA: hypothetical protein VK724_21600 [Bryobacteraceae bacterium]|nr:hypothetical protein [Bryobacteraceae bacterium]